MASLEVHSTSVGGEDDEPLDEGEKSISQDAVDIGGVNPTEVAVDVDAYEPTILPDRRWKLSELDLGNCDSICPSFTAPDCTLSTWQNGSQRGAVC